MQQTPLRFHFQYVESEPNFDIQYDEPWICDIR